jgi:predicted negative regulator of RcsB-dependent stress response
LCPAPGIASILMSATLDAMTVDKGGWMRNTMIGVIAVAVLAVGLAAADKPTPAFQQAMKENGAALQKLAKDAEAKDYDAIAATAATLKKNFGGPVGKHFTDAKMADALKLCTAAFQAADGLEKAAKAKDEMALGDARKSVQAACAACHTAHHERLADGTFEIK